MSPLEARPLLWPPEFEAAAIREGWNIFSIDTDDGQTILEIEYIGQPEDWADEGCPPDPPWVNDDQVIAHCVVMAVFGGSEVHTQALRIEYDSHRYHYDSVRSS